jgi:hypothetical protein
VAFVEQATEQAIRIVLEEVRATIVDGPSAAGFYLIDVPLLNGAGRSRDQVLRVLRGRSGVIRFTEVAGG